MGPIHDIDPVHANDVPERLQVAPNLLHMGDDAGLSDEIDIDAHDAALEGLVLGDTKVQADSGVGQTHDSANKGEPPDLIGRSPTGICVKKTCTISKMIMYIMLLDMWHGYSRRLRGSSLNA